MTETTTATAATRVMPVGDDSDLPHIIIVGGGAGGLELATQLGDKLGRKKTRRRSPSSSVHARTSGSRCCTRSRPAAWIPAPRAANTRRRGTGTDSNIAMAR